jgi:signal transduction histidine kinase
MENAHILTEADDYLITELVKRLEEKNKLLQSQAALLLEMQEMNRKLRDAESVKSGFLSNIRNEINNPLASIIGFTQQLLNLKELKEDQVKRIAFLLNKDVFSLDFQLRNIFAAAEIEAGELKPKPAKVNVVELIHEQISYFSERAKQNSIQFNFTFKPSKIVFRTDEYMLQTIVTNLIANAIEYSYKETVINIVAHVEEGHLKFSIENLGNGIENFEYKHIFNRFHQIENGSTKTHQGHGLGLSIIKEMVDFLKGELTIDSEKNKSTKVKITLPLFSQEEMPEDFSTGNDVLFNGDEIF